MVNKIKEILKDSEEIVNVMEAISNLNNIDEINFHNILDILTEENNPFINEYILACTWMGHFEQGEYDVEGF